MITLKFLISPHLKIYSPVELKVVLKKPSEACFSQRHDNETIVCFKICTYSYLTSFFSKM